MLRFAVDNRQLLQFSLVDITKRKQAEQALEKSEKKYRHFFSTVTNGWAYHRVVTDEKNRPVDYVFLEVNDAYEHLTGLVRGDIIGKRVTEVLPGTENDPADWIGRFGEVALSSTACSFENYSEAMAKWYAVSATCPEPGHFIVVFNDITERKQAEEELRKEMAFSKSLVDTAQAIVLVLDTKGRILQFNPYMEEISGYKITEVKGKDWFRTFLPEEDHAKIHTLFQEAVGNTQVRGNINPILTRDGHERQIEWYSKTLKGADGNVVGVLAIGQDVTEQKKAERMLRDSLARFSRLAENSLDMIYRMSLPEGTYEYVSPASEKIFGYSPDEFYQSPLFIKQAIHPDWREYLDSHWKKLIAGDMPQVYEYQVIHKSGETRWINQRNVLIKDDSGTPIYIEGNVSDITERKQAETRLRESEQRFRNIAEMLPEMVFELDLSGNIKFSNRKSHDIFGYSEEDFVKGLNALEMVIPEERNLASERIRQRLAGEVVGPVEYTALRKDGSTLPVILNAVPIMKGLEPVGILGIMTDITERKSNEMALLTATQAAEEAKRAKDLFLAKVSHEIRTPLTAIIGFGELLEDADLTPEHKKYLAAINTSGSALSSLIDDVLDLSKADAGKLAVKQKEFSLHNLITILAATHELSLIHISEPTRRPNR
ncbi:MAG: PAS domain S-box protein, partial [Proteobacteria bacterium]|nr:PAS domain S-box protein [Pseudomonadota bacterium]